MDRLNELLLEWEDRKLAGTPVAVETLCPDDPTMARQLTEKISLLETFDSLLGENAVSTEIPLMIGKYEVRGVVGQGGMGVVYVAFDPALRRTVAIKSLNNHTFETDRLRDRFTQEGQLLAHLEHDHIVGVYEAGIDNGRPYLVMEYFPNGSLATHRASFVHAGPEKATEAVRKIAKAIGYAHSKGVLHRDLKPANILLDAAHEPMVCDFGLAKPIVTFPEKRLVEQTNASPTSKDLTGHADRPGTPPYMAPEQLFASLGEVDERTDIWAIGLIYFELLTGRRPFKTEGLLTPPNKSRKPVWTALERKKIGKTIRSIVEKCLATLPSDRYQHVSEVIAAIDKNQQRSRRVYWIAATVVIATFAVGLGIIAYHEGSPERKFDREIDQDLANIQRGESVDLIQSGWRTPYIIREGQEITSVVQKLEGVEIKSSGIAIVEFLPRIPAKNYEILATIRHDAATDPNRTSRIGIANSGFFAENNLGRQHILRTAIFNGFDAPNEIFAEYGSLWVHKNHKAVTQVDIYRQRNAKRSLPNLGTPNTPWVNVQIRTTGESSFVRAECNKKFVGPFDCNDADYRDHCNKLNKEFPAAKDVRFPKSPRDSLAIYVESAKCTIREIEVRPLPEN